MQCTLEWKTSKIQTWRAVCDPRTAHASIFVFYRKPLPSSFHTSFHCIASILGVTSLTSFRRSGQRASGSNLALSALTIQKQHYLLDCRHSCSALPTTAHPRIPLLPLGYELWRIIVQCFLLLVKVPATCQCISGTDLQDSFTCRRTEIEVANFLPHPVTVYWHRADQTQRWPFNARRLAGWPVECQYVIHWYESTRKNPVASGIRTLDLPFSRRTP